MTQKPHARFRRSRGEAFEALAAKHLRQHGLVLLEKNFHCRVGEIDLVMRDGETLVFVEVRFRHTLRHGSPLESINTDKQRRLVRAASVYLLKKNLHDRVNCRFDCVGIHREGDRLKIDWQTDAFQPIG